MEDINSECKNCLIYIEKIKQLENIIKLLRGNELSESDVINELDLSEKRIEDLVEKYYTYELFFQGQKGIISFIYSYIIRDEQDRNKILYKCADQTKKIFQFTDIEGELHKDFRCKILLDSIYDILIKKVNKIYRIEINRLYNEEEKNQSDENSDSEDYDSDIEEVIANELQNNKEDKEDKEKTENSTIDDKVNIVVNKFLEIKKCLWKNRKPLIDDLSQILFL